MGLNFYRKWLHPEPKGYVRSYGLFRINHRIKLWLIMWSIFVMFNFMDQSSWAMVLRYMVRNYSGCFCEGIFGWNLHIKQGTLSKVDWSPSWGSASSLTQLCPTLCDPIDCGLPGSSVHRIFQARILEQVAISSSMGSSPSRDQKPCLLQPQHWQAESLLLAPPGKPALGV